MNINDINEKLTNAQRIISSINRASFDSVLSLSDCLILVGRAERKVMEEWAKDKIIDNFSSMNIIYVDEHYYLEIVFPISRYLINDNN